MINSRSVATAFALSVLIGLGACGSTAGTEAEPVGETIVVTDPSQEIVAAVGDRIELELELNVPSGFRWELASAPETAIVIYDGEVTDAAPSDEASSDEAPAAGEPTRIQRIRFEVVGAGATTLQFRYVQPWVDPPDPRSTIAFTLRVG